MPRGIQFSDDLKKRMVDMHKMDGISFAEIGRMFNLRRDVVSRVVNRCQQRGTTKSLKKSGRPPKTTIQQDRLIHRSSMKNPRFSARQVQIDSGINNVSTRTIRRRLVSFGLHGRRPALTPLVRLPNRRKRLQFAREHIDWTKEQWRKVLWSDETKVNLFSSDGSQYVRRPFQSKVHNPHS